MTNRLFFVFFTLSIFSCENKKNDTPLIFFDDSIKIVHERDSHINDDFLGYIEGITCNDSYLIVMDYHSGESFSLFDINSGEMIGRFGVIGQGPNELQLGTYGYIEKDFFYIFYDPTGYIAKYNIGYLAKDLNYSPEIVFKYNIDEAQFSRISLINDSVFLGAGTYNSKFQYALFNKSVIDYCMEIHNSSDLSFNKYHKFLSNQGILVKQPDGNNLAYSVNYSSNIDFFSVESNEVKILNSLRLNKPNYTPIQTGELNRVSPSKDDYIGYLDLSATDKYLYALYTDKKIYYNGVYNDFNSNIILVFDWNGNPICKYELPNNAYYISVNEYLGRIYAVVRNKEEGWSIVYYELN